MVKGSVGSGWAGEAEGLFVGDERGSRRGRRLAQTTLKGRSRRPHIIY